MGWVQQILVGKNRKLSVFRALCLALVAYLFFTYLLMPVRVNSVGMEPELKKGGLAWVWLPAYWSEEPRAGDLVAIRLAGNQFIRFGRIYAEPGQSFKLAYGRIFVDGREVKTRVFENGDYYNEVELNDFEYFVVGNNRQLTHEQLHMEGAFGKVKRNRIIGKLVF